MFYCKPNFLPVHAPSTLIKPKAQMYGITTKSSSVSSVYALVIFISGALCYLSKSDNIMIIS